jgi:DUF177 domain-containing protein
MRPLSRPTPAHEFAVPASSLDAGGQSFAFPVRAGWIREALEGHEATAANEDGRLEVRLSKSGNDVVVHGRLTATLTAPCARCLDPVALHVDETVSALMVHAGKVKGPGSNEYEFSPEEADTVPYDGETVVLDDLVRDELLLEIPMIPLCREDCPGMRERPQVAKVEPAEKPVDPRLLPLMRLKQTTKE